MHPSTIMSAPAESIGPTAYAFCPGSVKFEGLHEFNEAAAHTFHYAHRSPAASLGVEILGRFQRASCGKHAHHTAARGRNGGLDGRLHPYERYVVERAQSADGGGRRRIAGHDHRLGASRNQEVSDVSAACRHKLGAFVPVGAAGVVGIVDETVIREKFANLPENRQSAGA